MEEKRIVDLGTRLRVLIPEIGIRERVLSLTVTSLLIGCVVGDLNCLVIVGASVPSMLFANWLSNERSIGIAGLGMGPGSKDHGRRWSQGGRLPMVQWTTYQANQFLYWYFYDLSPQESSKLWSVHLLHLTGTRGFTETKTALLKSACTEMVSELATRGEKITLGFIQGVVADVQMLGDYVTALVPVDWFNGDTEVEDLNEIVVTTEWEVVQESEIRPTMADVEQEMNHLAEEAGSLMRKYEREGKETAFESQLDINATRRRLYRLGRIRPKVVARKRVKVLIERNDKQTDCFDRIQAVKSACERAAFMRSTRKNRIKLTQAEKDLGGIGSCSDWYTDQHYPISSLFS